MRYILSASSEGGQHLRNYTNRPLSCLNCVLITTDEAVKAWLLSNPVFDNPLDLLIYCHPVLGEDRAPKLALRGHDYLVCGPNLSQKAIAEAQLRGCLQQPETR